MHRTFLTQRGDRLLWSVLASTALLIGAGSKANGSRDLPQVGTERSAFGQRSASNGDLSDTAHEFVAIVESGEPSRLPDFWSKSGVTFGVDGAVISRQRVVRQLQQRLDLYCFFFDITCLREQDDEQRRAAKAPPRKDVLYSYRDLFRNAKSKDFKLDQDRDGGVLIGHVRVTVTSDETAVAGKRVVEFIFANENGQWKLTSVPYE